MDNGSNLVKQQSFGERTYRETVARGFYTPYSGGLTGKHDNVRTYWEDQFTRLLLQPQLERLRDMARRQGRKLRILDLGCGAGQGYEFLTRIDNTDLSLDAYHRRIIEAEDIDLYFGIDLSEAMIEQGRLNYAGVDNARFEVADLREGLGPALAEAPFDIYFSSYGSLSHISYDEVKQLLVQIGNHAPYGALIMTDMTGRYSPEWPGYWGARSEDEKVRQYSMSYLYPEDERQSGKVERFPLRFWSGDEIHQVCAEASALANATLTPVMIADRSIMVGRHLDTREYGTFFPPLRHAVNRLHEDYMRTNLEDLLVDYQPVDGFPELNTFFTDLTTGWNALIQFTMRKLSGERVNIVEMDGWNDFHPSVQIAIMSMDRVIDSVAWMRFGDPRANIIEPQLSYMLQAIETAMQQGRGCGHALVSLIRVDKDN